MFKSLYSLYGVLNVVVYGVVFNFVFYGVILNVFGGGVYLLFIGFNLFVVYGVLFCKLLFYVRG